MTPVTLGAGSTSDRSARAMKNRRSNRRIEYRGEIKTFVEWTQQLNLNAAAVDKRLAAGWSVERAFETPVRFISPKGSGPYSRSARKAAV